MWNFRLTVGSEKKSSNNNTDDSNKTNNNNNNNNKVMIIAIIVVLMIIILLLVIIMIMINNNNNNANKNQVIWLKKCFLRLCLKVFKLSVFFNVSGIWFQIEGPMKNEAFSSMFVFWKGCLSFKKLFLKLVLPLNANLKTSFK